MLPTPLFSAQVDAFADRQFGGNPAAVFFTQAGGDADWMQKVKGASFAVLHGPHYGGSSVSLVFLFVGAS